MRDELSRLARNVELCKKMEEEHGELLPEQQFSMLTKLFAVMNDLLINSIQRMEYFAVANGPSKTDLQVEIGQPF